MPAAIDLDALKSDKHLIVANALKDIALTALGDEAVRGALGNVMNAVWRPEPLPAEARQKVFNAALEGLNAVQKSQLLEAYARMGHLYEIAGLAARDHFFDTHHTGVGEPSEFIDGQKSAKEALKNLAQPVFEVVMTQHPTNTNSLDSIKAQRDIGLALRGDKAEKIEAAVRHYMQEAPLLHRDRTTEKDANFTVRDETKIVLNALSNVYDDLPHIYEKFDVALADKFGAQYRPDELALNFRFGSWGSAGDKDGNNNITAENTLEAIILHKRAILQKYMQSLGEVLKDDAKAEALNPISRGQLALRYQAFENASTQYGVLLSRFDGARAAHQGRTFMKEEAFDDTVKQVRDIEGKSRPQQEVAQEFAAELKAAWQLAEDKDVGQALLDLARRVEVFGMGFGKIEYRETAEEYARVVGVLVPEYGELLKKDPKEKGTESRRKRLEKMLKDNNRMSAFSAQAQEKVRGGAERPYIPADPEKPYDPNDALPIAYHTLKRMELAREFPDMIQDNVLAECKGVHNMLEAVFVQRMAEKKGERPVLGVVPLFEEPETMKNVSNIMRAAYQSAAYQQHLKLVAELRHGGNKNKTQQVQIAHSDNARRAGLQAARGFIHKAHKELRALHEGNDIALQFFEGGSISDAYRNGVRSVSEMVDAFRIHNFMKFTFQGGDLVNYFNQPGSIERLLSRNITHGAKGMLTGKPDTTPDENGNGHENGGGKPDYRTNELIDDIAIEALTRTLKVYENDDFNRTHNLMGVLLSLLDYEGEQQAGSLGSRGQRAAASTAFAPVLSTALSVAIKPIEVDKIRTIGFSEAFQHASIVPSWIGSDKLEIYLRDVIDDVWKGLGNSGYSDEDKKEFKNTFFGASGAKELTLKQAQAFYKHSPAFRDAQDRAAYGIALTDPTVLNMLKKRVNYFEGPLASRVYKEDKLDEKRQQWALKSKASKYIDRLQNTYRHAAALARLSMPSKHNPAAKGFSTMVEDSPDMLRDSVAVSLEKISNQLALKSAYRDFLKLVKPQLDRADDAYWHLRKVIHNAGDTVVHGRVLPSDDTLYGKLLYKLDQLAREQNGREQPAAAAMRG